MAGGGGGDADFWCLDHGSEKFHSRLPAAEVGRPLKDIAPMCGKVSRWKVLYVYTCAGLLHNRTLAATFSGCRGATRQQMLVLRLREAEFLHNYYYPVSRRGGSLWHGHYDVNVSFIQLPGIRVRMTSRLVCHL